MRHSLTFLVSCVLSVIAGCSKPETDRSKTTNAPKVIDACSLLTSQEIEGVQGAPLKDNKPSANSQGGLTVSQCYFLLPIAADSIVLTVTQKADGSNSRDPKHSWEEIFHRDKEAENAREEKESKSPPPEKITGLGDEAFWAPRRFGGTIYVLKGNVYITISVGGQEEQATKLQKSKALAEIVLKRL
jgi:hypothetical protein